MGFALGVTTRAPLSITTADRGSPTRVPAVAHGGSRAGAHLNLRWIRDSSHLPASIGTSSRMNEGAGFPRLSPLA
jgi:hypothetical protein